MSCSRSPLSDRTNRPTVHVPAPAQTNATTTAGNQNNQATARSAAPAAPAATTAPANPATPASPPPPHRVHFALPGHDHTFTAQHLTTELPAIPWAPSREELRAATVGVRNAQTILRTVEASTTQWVSEYIAELGERFRMQTRTRTFSPIVPEDNVDSDARLDQYSRAIAGCNHISHGLKRNLREYAPTFDREVEFGDTSDTTHKLLSRYVFHGEYDGHGKRRRHNQDITPTEDTPVTANVAPDHTDDAPVVEEIVEPVTTVVVHAASSAATTARPQLRRTESSVQEDAPPVADQV
ncbi:hypothetical protein BGZ70_004670, partial [Mortierella alpina]